MNVEIPDTLRFCSGCGDLCSQCEFCPDCKVIHDELTARLNEAQAHAARADALFSQQPREAGLMPPDGDASRGAVARCIDVSCEWMSTLTPRQGFSLLAFGLALTWLVVGWIPGRIAR